MQDCARYVEEMTRLRREIHRRPEEGWTEFETQWKVFRALEALGWTIRMGLDVIRPEAVMGRNAELVEKAMVRAPNTACLNPSSSHGRLHGAHGQL